LNVMNVSYSSADKSVIVGNVEFVLTIELYTLFKLFTD
jgi:hypothetical protein